MSEIVQKYVQMIRDSGGGPGPPPQPAPPTDKEKIDWLYSVLTILDAKAGALLTFDGLLLAAASLMYEKIADTLPVLKVPSLVLILVALFAALLCLLVAQISYPFLGGIRLGVNSNAAEIRALGQAVETRTRLLGYAWRVSIVAVGVFMFFVLLVVDAVAG